MHYLYLITREDGEKYVGVTDNIIRRMTQHRNGGGSRNLYNTTFSYVILAEGDRDTIYSQEDTAIKLYNSKLNLSPGGYGGSNSENLPKGSKRKNSKLNEFTVLQIRNKYASEPSLTQTKLAEEYNVGPATIRDLCAGITWKHVSGPLTVNKQVLTLSEDKINKMRELRAQYYSPMQIIEKLGYTQWEVFKFTSTPDRNEKIKIAKELFKSGNTINEVCKLLKIGKTTAAKYRDEVL